MAVESTLGADVRRIAGRIESDSMDATRILMEDQEAVVLFEDLNGGRAAGNLYSTRDRIASALGVSKEGIVRHLMDAVSSPRPCEVVPDPDFRACEREVRLMSLPIPKYFPEDGGRYITAGVVVAELDGRKNVSFHRMMLMDDRRIAIRLVPRHLFTLYKEAKAAGKELKVSICVGACAEVLLAAATSMDFGADELEVASAMHEKGHGSPLKVGRCDNGILVPAECDYVLEARITLEETKEGPFVDITGTYDFERQQPVIEVDRIWTRKDPVFHLLLP
ncbi:MAG: UbiD family decarboxylase, partial [Candidatus Methanomethylophilaceae archaeon]|nr:UbiD family decarboxylase [Candidatus Methanomethylophilaceae archaeon]